ncbi:MAG: hypothetical protein P1U88_06930 [Thalassobaculaceae bacterium]|nr:hypothetical protein [Thalassobaculaceae bacterium]
MSADATFDTSAGFVPGDWCVWQKWTGDPGYTFNMTIAADGSISISGGQFKGVVQGFPNSYLSMAITDSSGGSTAAYLGNVVGGAMGGEVSALAAGGKVVHGIWTAYLTDIANAATRDFAIGK